MDATAAGPLLALETSTPTARVAVVDGDRVLAALEKTAARHSSNLLVLVDEALATAGLRLPGLCAITCGAGPGSFTGLRVGMAVAKGLALPAELPLVLVSSLEALAVDLDVAGALLVPCLDAGKDQVYARLYRGGTLEPLSPEWALAPQELLARVAETGGPVVAGGTGVDRYLTLFRDALGDGARPSVAGPSALSVARLARRRLERGETDDLATAVPAYGRPPDITTPKKVK
jgi:tRNA threonylcarbamoyladenosine biosynthesis protein TsaB